MATVTVNQILTKDELFARMRARRQRIIELVRLASAELGELHSIDRQAGLEFIAPYRTLAQQEFCRLLEPIDPYTVWADSHRDVVVGIEHCIRLRPMTPLGGE